MQGLSIVERAVVFYALQSRVLRIASIDGPGYARCMHLAKALFSFLAAVMAAAGAVRADSQSIVVRADATAISGVVSESNLAVLELNDRSASPNLCPVSSHNRIALPAVPTRKTCLWATNPRVPSVGRAELVELPMTYTRHRGALRYLTEGRLGLIRLSHQSERE